MARFTRPRWLHEAMKAHFWPLPKIDQTRVEKITKVIEKHDKEAEEWMLSLTKETILECFDAV